VAFILNRQLKFHFFNRLFVPKHFVDFCNALLYCIVTAISEQKFLYVFFIVILWPTSTKHRASDIEYTNTTLLLLLFYRGITPGGSKIYRVTTKMCLVVYPTLAGRHQ